MSAGETVPRIRSKPPTERGQGTRKRIIAAAVESFAENGYHGTSISDIGERANVQRGALYYHINSKEELLFEVVRQHVEEAMRGVEAIASRPLPVTDRLHQLITLQVETLLRRRNEVTVYYRNQVELSEERRVELRKLQARVETAWSSVLLEGAEQDLFRPLDPIVCKSIIGMVNSVHSWFHPDVRLTSHEIADILYELVVDGIDAGTHTKRNKR